MRPNDWVEGAGDPTGTSGATGKTELTVLQRTPRPSSNRVRTGTGSVSSSPSCYCVRFAIIDIPATFVPSSSESSGLMLLKSPGRFCELPTPLCAAGGN